MLIKKIKKHKESLFQIIINSYLCPPNINCLIMKKLNNYKRIWLILMILSPFFSLVKAQTCDPNILKALSETRVTYFDKVTKGEKRPLPLSIL